VDSSPLGQPHCVLSLRLLTLFNPPHRYPRGCKLPSKKDQGGNLTLHPVRLLCTYLHCRGRLTNIYSADTLHLPLNFTAKIEMVLHFNDSSIHGGNFLNVNGDYHYSVPGSSGESRFSTSPLRKLRVGFNFKASKH
jgi:hypothetical protein